jgi:hypothetical protein
MNYQVRYFNIRHGRWFSHDYATKEGAVLSANHHAKRSDVGAMEVWHPGDVTPTEIVGQFRTLRQWPV